MLLDLRRRLVEYLPRRPQTTALPNGVVSWRLLLILATVCPSGIADGPKTSAAFAQEAAANNAKASLTGMRDYLVNAATLEFTTEFTVTSDLSSQNRRGSARFSIRRPGSFRVEVNSNAGAFVFISNGETLTLYRPREGKYAEVPARRSILATMYLASGLLTFEARVLDFLWTVDFGEDVKFSAGRTETIKGRQCRRFTVERFEDKWDVWLQANPPLPCRLVSRRTDGSAQTVQTNDFTWTTLPALPPELFSFSPPQGSRKVEVSELE
jgi:outer membrane lipoprotein-sorting protein